MNIKAVVRAFCAGICLAGPAASQADDTDIYLSTNTEVTSTPLVMFTLDVRPNVLSASYCDYTGEGTSENPDDCYDKVGPEIYERLREADAKYDEFDYVADGVTKFDAFRALHAALYSDLEGVSIGFMATHDEASGGGAYVLRGFREFQAGDANGAKQELLDKLYSIPIRGGSTGGSTGGDGGTGGGGGTGDSTCVAGPSDPHIATDAPLTYTVTDLPTVRENENAEFRITVTGTVAKNKSATLSWSTAAGTASAGLDYTTVSSSKTWNAPKSSALTVDETITVTVDLAEDGVAEPSEVFTLAVNAGNNAKAATATATVCDAAGSGGGGTIAVSVDDPAEVKEGDNAVFAITLAAASTGTVTVDYTTQGGAPGISYTATSGTVTFTPGEVSKEVSVATRVDPNAATDTFSLVLSNAESTAVGQAVTLADDSGSASVAELADCVTPQPKKNWTHAYQGSTMYFELFRYLTGQDVYRGGESDGLDDYGTDDATDLDEECWKPGGEGILGWDEGGPKPLDEDNVYVQQNGRYISPLTDAQQCTDVYALNMAFGVSKSDNGDLTADAEQSTANGGLDLSLDSGGNQWPQLIEHLGSTDLGDESVDGWEYPDGGAPSGVQKLNTYILELGGPGGQFSSYAAAGANVIDGSSQNMEEILEVFRELFRQILSVSTTFVSASVPVDVFNRASVNDNVFIALFTTDPELKASWVGNVKKLKLFEKTSGGFILYDKAEADKGPTQGAPPLSAIGTDGRIRYGALTFWTQPSALPAPPTNPADDDEARFMEAGKDGRFVARGGAGQNIPGFIASSSSPAPGTPGLNNSASGARQLFTEAAGSNPSVTTDDLAPIGSSMLAPLDVSAASALYTDLDTVNPESDADSPTKAANLLCYARGLSDADNNGNFCNDETARSWILGDALHSRPLPINYGDRDGTAGALWSKTNPDIRIMMGSNDGFMRMIQNTASTSGDELGVENWAFMPRLVMKNLAVLKNNNAASPHPYGVDGTVTLLTDAGGDNNIRYQDGDRAWVYFGLRRGGDAVYAMDVSNPDSPALKWVIDSSTEGFEEMTMSFSTPVIGVVQYGTNNKREVVVFGGGYLGGGSGTSGRTGYDVYADNGTDTGVAKFTDDNGDPLPSKGNAVYVVDADTGELIWKVTGDVDATVSDDSDAVIYANGAMEHSIAAQVTLVDTNGDGIDDRAYVPDLGGNVWRIDLQRSTTIDNRSSSDTAADIHQWQAVKIAALGNGAGAGSNDRRFMDRIDFVASQYPDSQTAFDALLLGSGDREHPRDTSVDNYFFMLKDANGATPPSGSFSPVTVSLMADANCFLGFADDVPDSCDTVDEKAAATAALAKGWRIPMEATGEKVLAPSVTVANEVFFTSYLPEGEPDAEGNPDPCQVGFEGTGRFYAVSLFNGYPAYNQNLTDDLPDGATTLADRYSPLKSKGIPSEMVPLGPGYYIRPDLEIGKTSGSSRFRTFWYEKNVD